MSENAERGEKMVELIQKFFFYHSRKYNSYLLINVFSALLPSLKKILRLIPFKVRAITCKNYLPKIYSQHGNFLNAI